MAMSPPVAAVLARLASVPKTGRGAVVFVGMLSIFLSLLNWGLSLIFSGLLVREIARRTDIRLDYRAAGAAGYLGLGCGFTLGITSSAAQLQANAGSIPASLLPITGVIGFSETILTWQNMVTVAMVSVVSATICYFTTPAPEQAKTAEDLGVALGDDRIEARKPARPGDWLEFSPLLTILIALLAAGWLWQTFQSGNPLITLSGLNTYNFVFLILGIVLHWRPRSLIESFSKAMPSVSGRAAAVSVLRRHRADLDQGAEQQRHDAVGHDRALVRRRFQQFHRVFIPGRNLFGTARLLRAVGRRKVDHRGALHHEGGQRHRRASRLDGDGLQHRRDATELHQPVLDAAAAWHPRPEVEGPDWLHIGAVLHPLPDRDAAGRDPDGDLRLSPADPALSERSRAPGHGVPGRRPTNSADRNCDRQNCAVLQAGANEASRRAIIFGRSFH
ncbi:hypothetical protein ACVIF9_006335 [Bradyrhizobium sp. USDA 4350]